ncbi:holin family protein [Azotobacter chroococcum]|uniref:Holin family protein n=1 Tax=Azotobacter chroococcum TaxID=353 RepID=A0AAQ0C0B4_9GAMM|nr:holin family protein [Azotobacter chroococcum]QQE90282.1 holin family protein [Azotobacter chroococcum]
MTLLATASALLPTVAGLLDRLIPDPEQKARAQVELLRLQQDGAFKELDAALQINLAQAKINEIEAASQSGLQAGWRPLAGYVCVAGLAYEFLVRPLLPWLLTVAGAVDVPPLPSLDDVLFELVFGMLGLGTLRTADRWKRVTAITSNTWPGR